MASVIGAVSFSIIAVMTIFVAFGAPVGEYTMGGKYRVLPKSFRLMALMSFFVQIFAIIIVLQTGGYLPLLFSNNATKNICIFFAVYLSLNTLANFSSKSKKERLVMTPVAMVTAICFWVTALV